jgi:uncharacterized cupin superfamily protein
MTVDKTSPVRTNVRKPHFDEPRGHDGFRCLRARIGRQAGSERIGASLFAVPPGEAAYPYHWHLAEEEMVVILEGTPLLRTPDGERRMEQGEVAPFLRGEGGAHQIINDTDSEVRFLAVSTQGEPDIVMYPDSGKLGAFERRPEGGGLYKLFRLADEVDYWDDESR